MLNGTVEANDSQEAVLMATTSDSDIWHQHLAHVREQLMKKLGDGTIVIGVNLPSVEVVPRVKVPAPVPSLKMDSL